jgi:hypothetical protein
MCAEVHHACPIPSEVSGQQVFPEAKGNLGQASTWLLVESMFAGIFHGLLHEVPVKDLDNSD